MEPVFLYLLLDSHTCATILLYRGGSLKLVSTKQQDRSIRV